MSTMFSSKTFVSEVLGLLVFIGINLFLPDHLVLILPVVCFLGFLVIFGGTENWNVVLSFHGIIISYLLASWNACIFHLREGKGITAEFMIILHRLKILDSAVWFFLCIYMPLTFLMVKSVSTVSVSKQVLINPKIKLQEGLISLAMSAM